MSSTDKQGSSLGLFPTSPPLYPHFNWPSGFWPCVKSCLVGGSDKYLAPLKKRKTKTDTKSKSISCWSDFKRCRKHLAKHRKFCPNWLLNRIRKPNSSFIWGDLFLLGKSTKNPERHTFSLLWYHDWHDIIAERKCGILSFFFKWIGEWTSIWGNHSPITSFQTVVAKCFITLIVKQQDSIKSDWLKNWGNHSPITTTQLAITVKYDYIPIVNIYWQGVYKLILKTARFKKLTI